MFLLISAFPVHFVAGNTLAWSIFFFLVGKVISEVDWSFTGNLWFCHAEQLDCVCVQASTKWFVYWTILFLVFSTLWRNYGSKLVRGFVCSLCHEITKSDLFSFIWFLRRLLGSGWINFKKWQKIFFFRSEQFCFFVFNVNFILLVDDCQFAEMNMLKVY
jgi:hypothetical protein